MSGPLQLEIKNKNGKAEIRLGGNVIHHVESYKVESLAKRGYAKLSMEILVKFPASQENIS